jgi:serine/threonine protein kinase
VEHKDKHNARFGAIQFISPEAIERGENWDNMTKEQKTKRDMWTVGVLIVMLLTGSPPFRGGSDKETLDNIKTRSIGGISEHEELKYISKQAKNLVRQLLNLDVDERPTAKEALQHTWFRY